MLPLFGLVDNVINQNDRELLFDELIKLKSQKAGVINPDGAEITNPNIRDANITSLEQDHWLAEKLLVEVDKLNSSLWGFELSKPEQIQIIDYSTRGHYNWHFDVLPENRSNKDKEPESENRLITAVLNLSDESEYTMGDLMLHDPVSGVRSPGLHGCGSMIVFPSNHWHRATAVTSGFRRVAVLWVWGDMNASKNHYVALHAKQTQPPIFAAQTQEAFGPIGVPFQDGIIVYRPNTNHVYILDALAGLIWQSLTQGVAEQDLVNDLSQYFNQTKKVISSDIQALKERWLEGQVFPDETAQFYPASSSENKPVNSHTYQFAGFLFQIDFSTLEVAKLMQPLLSNLEVNSTSQFDHHILIEKKDQLYFVSIDNGERGAFNNAGRTVLSVLNEIQRLCLNLSQATLMFGSGGLFVNNSLCLMPDLIAPGRIALMLAIEQYFQANFLSSSTAMYFANNNTVVGLPLPSKLREIDVELLAEIDITIDTNYWFGTPSDKQFLLPNRTKPEQSVIHYFPKVVLFAQYEPDCQTELCEIPATQGLSSLMSSGSYFVQSRGHIDLQQLANTFSAAQHFQLKFNNLKSALKVLKPLFDNNP